VRDRVILKLNGGLGNQMFQWALARMIEETTDMEVYLDMSYFQKRYARPFELGIFRLEPKLIEDKLTKLKLEIIWRLRALLKWEEFLGITLYSEAKFNFDPSITRIKPNTFIEGFFQSELYFKCIEKKLREDFVFAKFPDGVNSRLRNEITSENSVSLHIRRGDYVQKKRYQDVYATCSLDYYKRGVELIAQKHPNPIVFIFSDDIPWVKKNLKLPYECVYVSHNTGENSYEDMRLMSLCKHNVIANSSFSWWGAWLNTNPEKIVVAPQKWFNDENIIQTDVIPENWMRLDNGVKYGDNISSN